RPGLLPAGRDEDGLLAVRDAGEAFGVDLRYVAAPEPAVVGEDGAGRLLVSVVAGEVHRAADEELAVLVEAELDAGQRRAHRAEPEARGPVHGRGARALGQAVALEHEYVEGVQEAGDLRSEEHTS